MPYFAYIVGGWVQKEDKFCLRNKSMAPKIFDCIFCYTSLIALSTVYSSIHGHIVIPAVAVAIIDTPQFQRLRFLKQV